MTSEYDTRNNKGNTWNSYNYTRVEKNISYSDLKFLELLDLKAPICFWTAPGFYHTYHLQLLQATIYII